MNYHLIKNDYPPVIIKSADKKSYLFALHEADTGNIEAFKKYIGEQLIWSYEISIKAAGGQNIDEPGDWEKKINLLQKSFNPKKSIEKKKSSQTIRDTLINVALPLINFLLNEFNSVTSLFLSHAASVKLKPIGSTNNLKSLNKFETFFNSIDEKPLMDVKVIEIDFILENFKYNGTSAFSLLYKIHIELKDFSYTIDIVHEKTETVIEEFYHNHINQSQKETFANYLTDKIIFDIDQHRQTPLK